MTAASFLEKVCDLFTFYDFPPIRYVWPYEFLADWESSCQIRWWPTIGGWAEGGSSPSYLSPMISVLFRILKFAATTNAEIPPEKCNCTKIRRELWPASSCGRLQDEKRRASPKRKSQSMDLSIEQYNGAVTTHIYMAFLITTIWIENNFQCELPNSSYFKRRFRSIENQYIAYYKLLNNFIIQIQFLQRSLF